MSALAVKIDVNKTIDQILNMMSFKTKFNIVVVNKTENNLTRVGAYNDSANWPVGDIEANSALQQEFEGNSMTNSFSFAANYELKDGKFFQLVATWPTIGYRKIGLGHENEGGNNPAKEAWDKTSDSNDKAANNSPYAARAFMKTKGDSVIWVYEVSK